MVCFYFEFTIDHARLRPRKLPKEARNAQDGSDELLQQEEPMQVANCDHHKNDARGGQVRARQADRLTLVDNRSAVSARHEAEEIGRREIARARKQHCYGRGRMSWRRRWRRTREDDQGCFLCCLLFQNYNESKPRDNKSRGGHLE
jgi:hypothetical protein